MKYPLMYEEALYAEGYTLVGGVDEAGRGPLAGPVVAAAVIMPRGLALDGVDDSKKLSPRRRDDMAERIRERAVAVGVGVVEAETIDRVNILQASLMAMAQAVAVLSVTPDAVLVDGRFTPPLTAAVYGRCLVHGDALSHSVAAASIIAKVYRDALMDAWHEKYPQYGFGQHRGYGTAAHIAALRQYGPCPIHRRSFKVKGLSNG